ncbi:hypothetical protein [Paenibacillus taichungensis]|uniref:hypothetical protein n=1 Tax=Paenibacillus taichungensis TaxID=484184 RepID=UPI0039A39082
MSINKIIKYHVNNDVKYKIVHTNKTEWLGRGAIHCHNVKIQMQLAPFIYKTLFNKDYGRSTENKIDSAIREYFGSELE